MSAQPSTLELVFLGLTAFGTITAASAAVGIAVCDARRQDARQHKDFQRQLLLELADAVETLATGGLDGRLRNTEVWGPVRARLAILDPEQATIVRARLNAPTPTGKAERKLRQRLGLRPDAGLDSALFTLEAMQRELADDIRALS